MTKLRRTYILYLVFRCLALIACLLIFFLWPDELDILQNFNFFRRFSVLHLLWGIWVADMVGQIVPVRKKVPLGSQKLFRQRFKPVRGKINEQALRRYIVSTTKAAYVVMLLLIVFLVTLSVLHNAGVICDNLLFLFSVALYACDLVFVLVWCPLRLILRNRCCTTCRIYNWDHLMIFSPMLFIKGFFSISLLALALVVWVRWELCVLLHPERFWEHSNQALRCSECTDQLCTRRRRTK